jgi:benzoate 4-monooxygenase
MRMLFDFSMFWYITCYLPSFVSLQRGVFNTRSRPDHTRKRKIVSHVFSQKNVLEFEPNIRQALLLLTKQWDKIATSAAKGVSEEGGWYSRSGRAWFDCLPCEFFFCGPSRLLKDL